LLIFFNKLYNTYMTNCLDKVEDPILLSLLDRAEQARRELPIDAPTTLAQAQEICGILWQIRLGRTGFHNFHPGPENNCILDIHRASAKAIVPRGDPKVAKIQSEILECVIMWSELIKQVKQATQNPTSQSSPTPPSH